ncbi:MAG: EF-hand domain-containing protein [Burkholderiales bacterium]|nr:EF-hand domain-containing protein [Burkholderiales bacterium]
MKPASPRPFAFDARSVMLFAALTMGGAASVRAQTPAAPPAPRTQASPFATGAAAPAPSPADAAFERADTNHDGQLSPEEAQALPAIADRFEQLDKNRDGMLSREEFYEGVKY